MAMALSRSAMRLLKEAPSRHDVGRVGGEGGGALVAVEVGEGFERDA